MFYDAVRDLEVVVFQMTYSQCQVDFPFLHLPLDQRYHGTSPGYES